MQQLLGAALVAPAPHLESTPHSPRRPLPPPPPPSAPHRRLPPPPPPAAPTSLQPSSPPPVAPAASAPAEKKPEKTPEELAKRRKLICAEILQTEERYVEQLEHIVSCYQLPLQKANVLPPDVDRTIFINVGVLTKLHFEFLRSLRRKMGAGPNGEDLVGEAMLEIMPMLTLYIEYINRFHDGGVLLRKMAGRRKFRKALEKCSHSNLNGLVGLETLMVVPVQRPPRYVLLLREVCVLFVVFSLFL